MLVHAHLNQRHQNILRTTIRHYIATAEPVGSKTLVDEYNFSVSSATIRNALGKLEKAGFLYQPHISAGRIPSDSGYRIYVDQLMTVDQRIKSNLQKHLKQSGQKDSWRFESLLQHAAHILANLSGYIALITLPQATSNQLRHLQLIPLSLKQIMLIVVTDNYQTQSILIDIPSSVETSHINDETELADELQILSNFLNHQLRGRSLSELLVLDWEIMGQEFAKYTHFLKVLVNQLSYCLQESATPQIMIHGVSEVLRQPEFNQLEQVQMLLHLLEKEQEQLLPLIFEIPEIDQDSPQLTIRIGAENPLEPMRSCTLVSAIYKQGKIPIGSVGIIGPTRMLYENTIPLVETTADYLSDALS